MNDKKTRDLYVAFSYVGPQGPGLGATSLTVDGLMSSFEDIQKISRYIEVRTRFSQVVVLNWRPFEGQEG